MERAGSPGPARVPAAINSPFGESATRPRRTATTSTAPPPLLVTHPVSSMSRQSTLGGVLRFGSDAGDPPLAEPRLAPLGDEGWAVPPSFEDGGGGGIVNVRGADWERRLQSREQSIAMTEAELRRAVEHADTERARREAALEQREQRAAEATAKAAEAKSAAEVATTSEQRAKAATEELKQRVDRERAELQAEVKRRETAVDAKERELKRDAEEIRARAEREAAETRAKALQELRATKKLVGDSQRELDRLRNEHADAEASIDRARAEAVTTRDAAEGEADALGADSARVRESTRVARDALDALEKERDHTRSAIEQELGEMRDARERHAAALASERAASDAAHAASASEIDEKLHRLREMSAAYVEQTRVMDAKIQEHALEVDHAREAARAATQRAERAESEAAASRSEAAELGANARAALEDAAAEREANAADRAAVEEARRDVESFRERARVESSKILEGRESVLREWEARIEKDDETSRQKRREGEDSLRRWAVEVKRKEDAFVAEQAKLNEALNLEREEVREARRVNEDTRAGMSADVQKGKVRMLREVDVQRDAWKLEAEEERKKTEEERSAVAKQLRVKSERVERMEKELIASHDKLKQRIADEYATTKANMADEIETQRKDRIRCDELKAEALMLHEKASEDRALAAKLKGETEGHNKAAVAQREDMNRRAKALDHREEQLRDALVDLREREDKAGAAIAKSTALVTEHKRQIQTLQAKEASAEQRERQAAQQSAAAEATLLAAGQWERHAGEREAALTQRGKELEVAMIATENAGREVQRELDMARAARVSLADADAALSERDEKLNSSWMTLQSELATMIRGTGDGFDEVPTEAKVAQESRDAAAAATAFTVQIPHAVGVQEEPTFSHQLGKIRGALARKETALQTWALSLSKAGATLAAERRLTSEAKITAVELRHAAEMAHQEAAVRLEELEMKTETLENERRGVERRVKELDVARLDFQAEKQAAEESRRAAREMFAKSEAFDAESNRRMRTVEPREEKVAARERSAAEKEDEADQSAARAKALMQEAKAMHLEVEKEKTDVERRSDAVELKVRAQAEQVATAAAERDAERAAELRKSRAELKANQTELKRQQERLQERSDDSEYSQEYHDARDTVARSTRRSPRAESMRRTSDLDVREARLREETTRVEAERSTLSALREGAIVAASVGLGSQMMGGSPVAPAQMPTPAPSPSPPPAPPAPQNTPEGSFSFAPPPQVVQSAQSVAPSDAVSRAVELDRARAVTDAEATRARAYAEAEATRARAHAEELERYKAQVSSSQAQAMEAVTSAREREFVLQNERRDAERERNKLDERLRERERNVREAAEALDAKRRAVEQEAAAAARASEAAADAERRSKELKEAAQTERKKVSDELHAARVEAETSRAWVRRQQEELTQRMRAASTSPRSVSLSRGGGTPGSVGSVGSLDARAAQAARTAGLSGLTGLGRGVSSMLRPPGALAGSLSPMSMQRSVGGLGGFSPSPLPATRNFTEGGEDSPEAAAARAVAGAVAEAAQRAAAQFGSPAQ